MVASKYGRSFAVAYRWQIGFFIHSGPLALSIPSRWIVHNPDELPFGRQIWHSTVPLAITEGDNVTMSQLVPICQFPGPFSAACVKEKIHPGELAWLCTLLSILRIPALHSVRLLISHRPWSPVFGHSTLLGLSHSSPLLSSFLGHSSLFDYSTFFCQSTPFSQSIFFIHTVKNAQL